MYNIAVAYRQKLLRSSINKMIFNVSPYKKPMNTKKNEIAKIFNITFFIVI